MTEIADPPIVDLDTVLITTELQHRSPRPSDTAREVQALHALSRRMAGEPSGTLARCVEQAVELCGAGSAGVSLLERSSGGEEHFRWAALAGSFVPHLGGTTPRHFSPCGVCLDYGRPVLLSHPARRFRYFQEAEPEIVEGLVVPLSAAGRCPPGTIWIVSHDEERHFDLVDAEILARLAGFAALALRMNGDAAEIHALSAEKDALLDDLDRRIAERTRDLAETNARLLQEMEEHRYAEEALRQSRTIEAVGRLTGNVAHDFNNVLTAIQGNLEFAESCTEDAMVQRLLRSAQRAANRGAKLTSQLLAFACKQPLLPKPVDLNDVLVRVQERLLRMRDTKVRIEMRLQPELWAALVDADQVELAVLNLALNACDAMPKGGRMTLETENTRSDPRDGEPELGPGDYVRVRVTDTGKGMPEEVLARAFEPFFTTKDAGDGVGLGLSMVHGFARQSGGAVWIASAPNAGTAVRLYLPRAPGRAYEGMVRAG